MTGNLKGLGLTAIVAIAAGLAAVPAQAEMTFTGHEGNHVHTTFIGTQNGNYLLYATPGSIPIECEEARFTQTSTTGKEKLLTGSAASKSTCKAAGGGTAAHVRMNSCDYRYNLTKKVASGQYEGTTDVHCGKAGDTIEFDITSEAFPTVVKCTVKVEEQTGLGTIEYEDVAGKNDVLIKAKVTKLKTITEAKSGNPTDCGIFMGKLGTHTGGTYTGETTLSGVNVAEEPVTVEVSGE